MLGYSITSSAMESSPGGTSMPSSRAVLRLRLSAPFRGTQNELTKPSISCLSSISKPPVSLFGYKCACSDEDGALAGFRAAPRTHHGRGSLRSREPPDRQCARDNHVVMLALACLVLHPPRSTDAALEVRNLLLEGFALGELLGKRQRESVVIDAGIE